MSKNNSVEFEIRLPRGIRVENIDINTIPIDANYETIVLEHHRIIDKLPFCMAQKKYGKF